MKKRLPRRRIKKVYGSPIIPFTNNIFSFGHVRGIAKVFLQAEIVLSLLLVIGTCIAVIIHYF